MKKGIAFMISASIFFTSAFAQTAPKIQRAYAFYTERIPGMAMADENGNTINPTPVIDRFIYVECPGINAPDIRSVLFNNVAYTPKVSKANDIPVQAGKNAETNKDIALRPAKGCGLWKLELQVTNDVKDAPKDAKYIVIKGRYNKRSYVFHLYKETRLMTPDSY